MLDNRVISEDVFLVCHNWRPFNAMLLEGLLPFNSRKEGFPVRGYSGKFIFYNSIRTNITLSGEIKDKKLLEPKSLVGEGTLREIRELTHTEKCKFYNTCLRMFHAQTYGYFFEDLKMYDKPIKAEWPTGCVNGAWIHKDYLYYTKMNNYTANLSNSPESAKNDNMVIIY